VRVSGHDLQDEDFVADCVVTIGAITIVSLTVVLIVVMRCV
jgi:hypothetical protein